MRPGDPFIRPTMAEALHLMSVGDSAVWHDVGGNFTCAEADATLALLLACGLDDHALALLEGHARSDDDDSDSDAHRGAAHDLEVAEATGDIGNDSYDPGREILARYALTLVYASDPDDLGLTP